MKSCGSINLFQLIQIVFWGLSLVGIFIAWRTFQQNAKLKRAEWLKSLFKKIYESDYNKEIRWKVDNDSIQEDIKTNPWLEEKLVDAF